MDQICNDQYKVGTKGAQEQVTVSMIPFNYESCERINQYYVEFTPDIENYKIRNDYVREEFVKRNIQPVFDGKIIYLKEKIPGFDVQITHPYTKGPCKLAVIFTREFEAAECINVFNLIMRRCYDKLGFVQLGRYYYDIDQTTQVSGYDIEIIPGYETAVRNHDNRLQLNVETRFKVVRKDSVLRMIDQLRRENGGHIEKLQNVLEEVLIGKSIMTKYNNKILRCDRVDFSLSVYTEFLRDGEKITLKSYFESMYNLKVTDDTQPIIISEGAPAQPGEAPRQNFLIPEFCFPTGLTDKMRSDYKTMAAVARHTRLGPNDRVQRGRALLRSLKSRDDTVAFLLSWGVTLGDDLADATARVLGEQQIFCSNKNFRSGKGEWSREMKRTNPYTSRPMRTWGIVGTNLIPGSDAHNLTLEFQNLGRELKIDVADPVLVNVNGSLQQNFEEAIRGALSQARENNITIDCLVILLPNENASRYNSVKKLCCAEGGCPSQCINLAKLNPKGRDGMPDKNKYKSIVLKIFLQMQCKMGGALWKMNIPMNDLMIMGYDIYHDSSLRGTTVGACVSTIDKDYVQYYSQTKSHTNPSELGNNLSHFVRKALKKYYINNDGQLPKTLVIYRDGAGDGQIPHIRQCEVEQVREACRYAVDRAGGDRPPIRLAYIVVAKKVNLRIYRKTINGQFDNPVPGTVIDTVVTRPERFDFYMVPQPVNQGTVTPVSYNIVYDDTTLDADKHHSLAYKLCHLYFNWQGTVRVPAPCQYAHKMAFLVSQSLHFEADEGLRQKLFFL